VQALIVDESGNMRRFLRSILAGAGFEVLATDSAVTALKLLHWHPADLGLFECHLPEMSGVELLEKVRADPNCRHMKIVMVSAACNRGALEQAHCEGADECMVKPFNRKLVLDKLRTMGMIQ